MSALKKIGRYLSRRHARRSVAIAHDVQLQLQNKTQRVRLCQDVSREAGVPHPDRHGVYLELIRFNAARSKDQYGTYDTDETYAELLNVSPKAVYRMRVNLLEAGLIETGKGVPPGKRGPHVHYRLTELFSTLAKGFAVVLQAVKKAAKKTVKTLWTKPSKLALASKPSTKAFVKSVDNSPARSSSRSAIGIAELFKMRTSLSQ